MENRVRKFKSVLVIDDTYVDRFIAERNLRKYEVADDVVLRDSAPSALIYLRKLSEEGVQPPELIFLDIRMPEMDGFEFLDEFALLPDEFKKQTSIIMLSTSLNPCDVDRANQSPYVMKFVNKPLDRRVIDFIRNPSSFGFAESKDGIHPFTMRHN